MRGAAIVCVGTRQSWQLTRARTSRLQLIPFHAGAAHARQTTFPTPPQTAARPGKECVGEGEQGRWTLHRHKDTAAAAGPGCRTSCGWRAVARSRQPVSALTPCHGALAPPPGCHHPSASASHSSPFAPPDRPPAPPSPLSDWRRPRIAPSRLAGRGPLPEPPARPAAAPRRAVSKGPALARTAAPAVQAHCTWQEAVVMRAAN